MCVLHFSSSSVFILQFFTSKSCPAFYPPQVGSPFKSPPVYGSSHSSSSRFFTLFFRTTLCELCWNPTHAMTDIFTNTLSATSLAGLGDNDPSHNHTISSLFCTRHDLYGTGKFKSPCPAHTLTDWSRMTTAGKKVARTSFEGNTHSNRTDLRLFYLLPPHLSESHRRPKLPDCYARIEIPSHTERNFLPELKFSRTHTLFHQMPRWAKKKL